MAVTVRFTARRIFTNALLLCFCAQIFGQGPMRFEGPLVAAEMQAQHLSGFTVETQDREAVRNFFNAIFYTGTGLRSGWNGSVANCEPGETSANYQAAVLTRINFYRAMAGVPADVTFNPALSAKARKAALMVSANASIAHTPLVSFSCFTLEGAEAAASSNLALGTSGIDSIEAYMLDAGNNFRAGHRRWLLYPQTKVMGNGDIDPPDGSSARRANANWIFDENFGGPRPTTRDGFVAWPPPGFVPSKIVYPRWSFSYPRADFSQATVTVGTNGVSLPVHIENLAMGYAENTIVFVPGEILPQTRATATAADDLTYSVTISNVLVATMTTNFTYAVTIFDPERPANAPLALTGSTNPEQGLTNRFRMSAVPHASNYEFRFGTLSPFQTVESGDEISTIEANISALYPVVQSSIFASSNNAFHLAHTTPPRPQTLTLKSLIVPSARSELRFYSRLGAASTGQVARAQVSLDDGSSWRDVFTQNGDGAYGELSFRLRTVSLAEFAGRTLQIRFQYGFSFGEPFYAPGSGDQIGWYLDDISVTSAQELTVEGLARAAQPEFNFVPSAERAYYLEARPRFFDDFGGEWTLGKIVTAVKPSPNRPEVAITAIRPAGTALEIEFQGTHTTAATVFQLEESTGLDREWRLIATPGLERAPGPSRFVFRIAASGSGARFFRVTID